ncbi:unnamed protein product [Anisakis simplex]|uniref:Acidic repeat-containing protein-like n=1 Tax=Anisakis simplex TaxID=6269 RepID=A0A0M3JBH0_ANISI|nr:unnamed protein product [Anisakis simplex]
MGIDNCTIQIETQSADGDENDRQSLHEVDDTENEDGTYVDDNNNIDIDDVNEELNEENCTSESSFGTEKEAVERMEECDHIETEEDGDNDFEKESEGLGNEAIECDSDENEDDEQSPSTDNEIIHSDMEREFNGDEQQSQQGSYEDILLEHYFKPMRSSFVIVSCVCYCLVARLSSTLLEVHFKRNRIIVQLT